jgi:proline iminopeptidase
MERTVNGVRLYYDTFGDPTDPSVMVFHGGPGLGDHRKGAETYRPLVEDGFQLVVYDHRGCGASECSPPYTNAQFAADAEALRQALDLGSITVIGGSYGGFIAQEYAIRYSEHLEAMVLRGTAARADHRDEAREIAASRIPAVQAADLATPPISKAAFDREMDGRLRSDADFRRTYHSIAPLYAPSIEAFDAAATRERIEQLTFNHEVHNAIFSEEHPTIDYTDQLPAVTVPTLVTVGADDWIAPPSYSRALADLLPNAHLEVFDDAGHSPNVDRPEAFLDAVRAFLRWVYSSE